MPTKKAPASPDELIATVFDRSASPELRRKAFDRVTRLGINAPVALLAVARGRDTREIPDFHPATWAVRALERKAKKDADSLQALVTLALEDHLYAMHSLPLKVEAGLGAVIALCAPDRKHWRQAVSQLCRHLERNKPDRGRPDVAAALARAVAEQDCPKETFVSLAMTGHPDADKLLAARKDDPNPVVRQWVQLGLQALKKVVVSR